MGHVGTYQANWQNSNISAAWSHQSFMVHSPGIQQTQISGTPERHFTRATKGPVRGVWTASEE